jgi:hypothetical protein
MEVLCHPCSLATATYLCRHVEVVHKHDGLAPDGWPIHALLALVKAAVNLRAGRWQIQWVGSTCKGSSLPVDAAVGTVLKYTFGV